MSVFVSDNKTIGILYAVESSVLLANTAYFFCHQIRQSGLKPMFLNKFVTLTLGASFCYVIFTLLDAIGFIAAPRSNALGALAAVSYACTLSAHVSLVYLRSQAVIIHQDKWTSVFFAVLILIVSIFVLSALCCIIYFSTLSGTVFIAASAFGLIGGVLLVSVEAIASYAFAKKISEIHSFGKNTTKSEAVQLHEKQSYLIARYGLAICSLGCVTVILIWISNIWEWLSGGTGDAFQWISWLASCLITTCLILWIRMKIKIDDLKSNQETGKVKSTATSSV
jgi:hypothetical protein